MRCPSCHCPHSYVTHTWPFTTVWQGRTVKRIKRRRQCRHCGMTFNTTERLEDETAKNPEKPQIKEIPALHRRRTPSCSHLKSTVEKTKTVGLVIVRLRKCKDCKVRFRTIEQMEE